MMILNIYLLAGLVVHKGVWEVLKRRQPEHLRQPPPETPIAKLAKLVKICILLSLVAQLFLPDIFPVLRAEESPGLRLAGALIYTLGLALALAARLQLGKQWSDIEVGQLQQDHQLINGGVYRFLRHPIYLGDLLLLLGFEMALNSWLLIGVLPLIPVVVRKALQEEQILIDNLPGYADYRRRTKGFVPFVA